MLVKLHVFILIFSFLKKQLNDVATESNRVGKLSLVLIFNTLKPKSEFKLSSKNEVDTKF
jgi:hypothetical protein